MILDKKILCNLSLSMSVKRPGVFLNSDQHNEILLSLEAEEIQRLYQEKFAEMLKDSNKKSTNSEASFNAKATPVRSLTAPQVRFQ